MRGCERADVPKGGYRRGFKTEAEDIALGLRAELGVAAQAPVCMRQLAEHLGIPVVALSDLANAAPGAVALFTGQEQGTFSAATVFDGTRRTIVHNDSHTAGRQASNIGHELAHGILLHEPSPAIDEFGCRYWNQQIEDEATWLAGVLLVPRAAAVSIARAERETTVEEAAAVYGVSTEMMNWRLNVTGARKQAARARR